MDTTTTPKQKLEEILKNKTFSQTIYHNIFKIFKENEEPYSSNVNGVFINLNDCKMETIDKTIEYILNIEKNNSEHEFYIKNTEKKLDGLKKVIKKEIIKKDTPKYNRYTSKKYDFEKKANDKILDKILDKELEIKKPIYSGVYKRIYNNMNGYKNKPVTTKKIKDTADSVYDDADLVMDCVDLVDDVDLVVDCVDDVDEVDCVDDVELEEIDFADLEKKEHEELFGYESD